MVGFTPDQGTGHGLTPHDIYVQITSGPDTDKLQQAHDAAQSETTAEQHRTQQIDKLTAMISDGWEGAASEQAYDATKPLGDTGANRAMQLKFAQEYLQSQIGAFDTAKHSVKPVEATPPPTAIVSEAVPWFGDIDGSMKAYQNDAQNNITVFSAYDNASKSNGGALPTEYPAFKDGGDSPGMTLSEQKADSGGSGTGGGTGGRHSGTGGSPVPGGSTGTHSSSQPAHQQGGHPVTQVPQVPGGSTSASSATSPPIYQPGSGGYPQAPAAQGPSTGSPGQTFGPYGGTGYGPGSGYGNGSGYGGGSGSGYGSGSGSGAGAGARTGGSPEGGARSGAGAMAAEEAMARRAGGAGAARGGMSGMGAMGGGHGGQGDEDTEHERPSFLQEDDPEDIFGTDEVTAPPVIE